MDGAESPGYAEWEAAEARRLARIGRLGGSEEQPRETLQASPPRGHQSASDSTGSSGSEGTSPVRSSYGRYLLARRALPPAHAVRR